MAIVKLILDVKDQTWIDSHSDKVLLLNEPIYHENGTVAYGDGVTELQYLVFKPLFSAGVFNQDIVVSLSGGKTMGKYVNGDTIPAQGKTPEEVWRLAAIEDIAPTYVIPTLSLTKGATTKAEVGTAYSHNLTATFTENDAGALTVLEIEKNGSLLGSSASSSPLVRSDAGVYVLGNISYQAFADYLAGPVKNYQPSNTPDGRPPQVRSVNAPQAASTNFPSSVVVLTGVYNIFFGSSVSAPVNSANVRSLSNRFSDAGNTFTLPTGNVNKNFSVCMPATMSLISVIDPDALGANITAEFDLSTFNVNDAGGNPVAYKIYTMTNDAPYPSNHNLTVTVG